MWLIVQVMEKQQYKWLFLGLRFMRVLYIFSIPEVMQYVGLLKTRIEMRMAYLICQLLGVVFVGSGMFHLVWRKSAQIGMDFNQWTFFRAAWKLFRRDWIWTFISQVFLLHNYHIIYGWIWRHLSGHSTWTRIRLLLHYGCFGKQNKKSGDYLVADKHWTFLDLGNPPLLSTFEECSRTLILFLDRVWILLVFLYMSLDISFHTQTFIPLLIYFPSCSRRCDKKDTTEGALSIYPTIPSTNAFHILFLATKLAPIIT